jgi:hypothetical protein
MEKCYTKLCVKEGTNFRDFSHGPAGVDYRNYCDDCVSAADREEHRRHMKRSLSYQTSVVRNLEEKLKQERAKLREQHDEMVLEMRNV